MNDVVRQTYVISDLHLGGAYPESGAGGVDRGFRICTRADVLIRFVDALTEKPVGAPSIELVVNGDLVDFLAERDEHGGTWCAFTFDQASARRKFDGIVARDRGFFDALGRFLAKGHRLVILLGNHDIELALPTLRPALAKAVGARPGTDFEFVPGAEAYVVGDALIEHGNRYDAFNIVDHERLARLCAMVSRSQHGAAESFDPPPGSHMVAEVINPIKEQYKFVDLLKPETGAVVPLLLLLEPGYRKILGKVALIASRARGAVRIATGKQAASRSSGSDFAAGGTSTGGGFDGGFGSDIAAGGFDASTAAPGHDPLHDEEAALNALLNEHLGVDAVSARAALPAADVSGSDISTLGDVIDRTVGMARLLVASSTDDHLPRLGALWAAFRSLQGDQSFDESVETASEYVDAAQALATNGVTHVVFGHTHMAKRIPLASGGFYLNSGTWADVMEFPRDLLSAPRDEALTRLGAFVQHLIDGDFSAYALFRPTYVRLALGADNRVATAELIKFTDAASV